MSFSNFKKKKGKFDFHKGSYKSECFYLLMLIKAQNPKSWTALNEEFRNTPDAKTWEFYQKLKDIYAEKKPTKKPKKVATSSAKKKKATKAPSKKKKVTKKAPKKVVKISAKKKVVKKPEAKKTAKKTVKKTTTRKKAA